jgi:hypothetical protein
LSDFGDGILELCQIFEVFIHRCKADIGDLVQSLKFLHHQLADVAGIDFALSTGQQFFFDRQNRRIDGGRRHRALAQRQGQAAAQLGGRVLGAAAILLDHIRHHQFDALIRGKSFITFSATPAPAYGIPLLRYTRIEDLGIVMLAERTFHMNQ